MDYGKNQQPNEHFISAHNHLHAYYMYCPDKILKSVF